MYKMRLMCEPGDRAAGETTDEYTCVNFSVKRNENPEVTIPSLDGWSYPFSKQLLNEEGLDTQGQMMGIPHAKFDKLTDSTGSKLSIEVPYQIYSAFTYFHTCCNILTEPDQFLKGIQDLKKIGDKNVSITSYELPIDLASLWVKKATYIVTDITKTTLFGIPVEIATIVTTHTIKAVPEAEV